MNRLLALDGIRGIAVVLVVVGHVSGSLAPYAANVGVTLFFVLSGYLITSLLLREHAAFGRISFWRFYARRALRLFPALLILLIATPILLFVARDGRLADYPLHAGLTGLYLSDFAEAAGFPMAYFNHTWSLAVEEQFYLVWPLILASILILSRLRNTYRKVVIRSTVLLLTLGGLAWRILASVLFDPDRVYYAPDTNAFVLLLGCSLAVLPPQAIRRIPSWAAVACLAAMVVGVLIVKNPSGEGRNWVVVIAAVVAVVAIAGAIGGNRLLSFRVLTFFGGISYGLYLWHNVLLQISWGGQTPNGVERPLLALASVGVAFLSFKLVELPLQKRFKPLFQRSRVSSLGSKS